MALLRKQLVATELHLQEVEKILCICSCLLFHEEKGKGHNTNEPRKLIWSSWAASTLGDGSFFELQPFILKHLSKNMHFLLTFFQARNCAMFPAAVHL